MVSGLTFFCSSSGSPECGPGSSRWYNSSLARSKSSPLVPQGDMIHIMGIMMKRDVMGVEHSSGCRTEAYDPQVPSTERSAVHTWHCLVPRHTCGPPWPVFATRIRRDAPGSQPQAILDLVVLGTDHTVCKAHTLTPKPCSPHWDEWELYRHITSIHSMHPKDPGEEVGQPSPLPLPKCHVCRYHWPKGPISHSTSSVVWCKLIFTFNWNMSG